MIKGPTNWLLGFKITPLGHLLCAAIYYNNNNNNKLYLHDYNKVLPHLVQFVKCWQIFMQWNSKVQEKKKESLETTSSTKRAIRQFHVVVGQGRRRSVRKSTCKVVTLPIQTYCFLLFFLPFSLPSPVSLLNLPICFVSGRSVGNWPKSSSTSLS